MSNSRPTLSVIVPAFNEATAIAATLEALQRSINRYELATHAAVELIVVDNNSTDTTAAIAGGMGALVVSEPTPGVANARNAGFRTSRGTRLLFIDADTLVPLQLIERVVACLAPDVVGGAVAPDYQAAKRVIRVYNRMWALVARTFHMSQGVAQFAQRSAFEAVRGYDPTLYMSEDADFYWKLQRYARARHLRTVYLSDIHVLPSCRRMDQWPAWKTILHTNPVITRLFLRSRRFWGGWYTNPPR
jgi:glycosyltransferase involved in cell wall biosynthesis